MGMNEEPDKEAETSGSDARVSGMVATFALLFLAVFPGLLVYISS